MEPYYNTANPAHFLMGPYYGALHPWNATNTTTHGDSVSDTEYPWYHVDVFKLTKRDRVRVAVLYDGPDANEARKAFDNAVRPRTVRANVRCYVSGTQCWRSEDSVFETHRMYRDWSEKRDL